MKLLESNMADEMDSGDEEHEIDFRRLKDVHEKNGYIEGLQAGEEQSLQQGFNDGFAEASVVMMRFGQLRGAISALLSFLTISGNKASDNPIIKELLDLERKAQQFGDKALSECGNELKLNGKTNNKKRNKVGTAQDEGSGSHPQTLSDCSFWEASGTSCKDHQSLVKDGRESIMNLWTHFNELITKASINLDQEELDSLSKS